MTNGFGVMYSYASRIKPEDRWAIAAYIRALQVSQGATLEDVPAAERRRLENQ
jgi:cytochrome c553